MMKEPHICTECFKALGVQSRMEIYKYLQDKGQATVGEVVDHVELTQPTVSYHLGEMKKGGILKSEKKGKEVYYSINTMCPHSEEECVLKRIKLSDELHV